MASGTNGRGSFVFGSGGDCGCKKGARDVCGGVVLVGPPAVPVTSEGNTRDFWERVYPALMERYYQVCERIGCEVSSGSVRGQGITSALRQLAQHGGDVDATDLPRCVVDGVRMSAGLGGECAQVHGVDSGGVGCGVLPNDSVASSSVGGGGELRSGGSVVANSLHKWPNSRIAQHSSGGNVGSGESVATLQRGAEKNRDAIDFRKNDAGGLVNNGLARGPNYERNRAAREAKKNKRKDQESQRGGFFFGLDDQTRDVLVKSRAELYIAQNERKLADELFQKKHDMSAINAMKIVTEMEAMYAKFEKNRSKEVSSQARELIRKKSNEILSDFSLSDSEESHSMFRYGNLEQKQKDLAKVTFDVMPMTFTEEYLIKKKYSTIEQLQQRRFDKREPLDCAGIRVDDQRYYKMNRDRLMKLYTAIRPGLS